MNDIAIRVKYKEDKHWGYVTDSVIMTKNQIDNSNVELSHFLFDKTWAVGMLFRLMTERREELEAIAIVRFNTRYKPATEYEVLDYVEL